MIDLHHHCLPDVDDGPREWHEAVEMCAIAAEEGIETIVATPHVLRGRWRTPSRAELDDRIAQLRERINDTPRLLLGSEYFFAHDMADVLAAGEPIVPLAGSRYVLIELAANSVPPMLDQPIYRAQLAGWIPILAHPERNTVFQARPEMVVDLINHGVRMQITAGSLTGEFGPAAEKAAVSWVQHRLVHFIASDAHNPTRRPPRVREAIARVRELAGDDVADALTRRNPLAVIENRGLEYEPEPAEPAAGGLLTRLRAFFARK